MKKNYWFSLVAVLLVSGLAQAAGNFTAFSNKNVQVAEYIYDFAVDGGSSAAAIDLSAKAGKKGLPVGAIVEQVTAWVETAVTSGGSATVEWGNGDDSDGYSGTAIAKATLVANYVYNGMSGTAPGALLWDDTNDAPLPLYIDDATTGKFTVKIGTADLTAGKIRFYVKFLK